MEQGRTHGPKKKRANRETLERSLSGCKPGTMREGATEEPQVVADGSRWDATAKNCL